MRTWAALLILALPLTVWTNTGQSAQMLTFHGPLRDAEGKRISAPAELLFRIYDAPVGGNLMAGPFHSGRVVPVDGVFSATFGPVLVERLGGARWLEVTAGASPLPRIEMEKVYYDAIDEGGKLIGGQTLMPRTLPAPLSESFQRSATASTTILDNGPSSNRIDLVFVGDGYLATDLGIYSDHVRTALNYLLAVEPFASYSTFFNAHRVDVISNESGVDNDPDLGINRDTALDMGFWCSGIERLLCVDVQKALLYAADAPAVDHVYAVANSTKYGGAGYVFNDIATFAGGNGSAVEIASHETGHSLGNLADEYDYGGTTTYVGPEPVEPNISTLSYDTMAASGTKWARWLGDPGLGYGGLVGTYEGAYYSPFGIYRPTFDSKMRSLGAPFNLPSVESLILEFYKIVRPIDDATPSDTEIDQLSTVFVDPVDPPGHPLDIQWYVDGVPVEGATQETLLVASAGVATLGLHVLSVTVEDNTPFVRNEDERNAWLKESRSWDLRIGDRTPRVTAPAAVTTGEGALLSFTVSAEDPDGEPVSLLTAAGTAITAGATFTVDPSNTSGTLSWIPSYEQAGIYNVTFTAANVLSSSKSTKITVNNVNRPPVMTAPATAVVAENTQVTIDVSAADPDGDTASLSADPLPPNAAFYDKGDNTGSLLWVPLHEDLGSHHVTFTATDGGGGVGTAETAITVSQPPQVSAANPTVSEAELLTFAVTAFDPDGDPIGSLTASPLPNGATFTPNGTNTSGVFHWTPDYTQAGIYQVRFTASNALSGQATAVIVVNDVVRPPVVTAPTSVNGAEGSLLTITVAAADPDGEPIDSLSAASLPAGAAFSTGAAKTTGTLSWVPDYTQAGSYTVTISSQSACRAEVVSGVVFTTCETGTATVAIEIGNTDRPPVLSVPASPNVSEGNPLAFNVIAVDPDGEALASLEALDLPFGATFTPNTDHTSGAFAWTPSFVQAGSYAITFRAANVLVGTGTSQIIVRDVNRAPTADAGGPYQAVAGIAVAFDGTGSSDPDGDALTYDWDFGDGESGSGATVGHSYAAGGNYEVVLNVSDTGTPSLRGSQTTTAVVQAAFDARLFTSSAYRTIRLSSSRPRWCVHVEPIAGGFDVADIAPSSIVLEYREQQISPTPGKAIVIVDEDRNGTYEIEICFQKGDLRTLFAALPEGRTSVGVTIDGSLVGGGHIRGSIDVDVVSGGRGLTASLSPNPLNPTATLTFRTTIEGPVTVSIFDLQGRLVRTLVDDDRLPAGYHDVRIDRESDAGSRLASGAYFYWIEASEGVATGRFVIMK